MTDKEQERLYRHLGKRIRQLRKEEPSLTQTELGEKIGLSRTSIVNIEKGRQHPPLHVIWEFAEALDVELGELLPSRHDVAGPSATIDPELARRIQEELGDGDEETFRRIAEFIQEPSNR